MGNQLSLDFFIDYAIYDGYLNDVEFKAIDATCRHITIDDFCGLHQMEAVIKLIWQKAIYDKSHVSNKYAHVVKKLENEVEGGTNIFSNVFRDFAKKTVASNLVGIENLNEGVREKISTKIATFLGHLLVVDAIDNKSLGEIIRPAYGIKSLDKAMKVLSEMIQKKLTTNNMTFDGLFQNKDVKKLKQEEKRKNSPSPAALENIKDYESYCSHYNSIEKKDIHTDERLFNPKLIASLKIKTKEEIQDLCEKFLDRCIQHESYLPIYAQIALRVHSSLQNTDLNKEISFRGHLIDTVVKRFEKVAVEKDELDQRIAIALYGEMYNLNWVSKVSMNNFIGALKALNNDNSYVILMQSLLKICSTKLAVQGTKVLLTELRDEMKKIARKEDRESHLKYMVHDSLSMLNYIVAIQEQYEVKGNEALPQPPIIDTEKLTIDNLYKGMSEEAYTEVINDIKFTPIENLAGFIEKLIQKALSTCSTLLAKATRDICTASYMKEVLSNKCHSIFLDYVKDANKAGSTFRLIHFIGELYNFDVLSNDFINRCFEILFEHQMAMGASALMRSTGLKMETANAAKLNGFFQFFGHVVKNEHSRQAKVFRKLMTLRANEWNDHGIQHSYEDFLMLYILEEATADEVAVKLHSDHVEIEKFIFALWKVVLKDPHPLYAELCLQLSKVSPEFNRELIEFIKQRGKTFGNLESQHYNEAVNCRLGKVVVFIAELFQLNVIPDFIFENFIEPRLASKIPQSFVLAVLGLVSQKIDETAPNGKLKTLITNLEHINEDKSQQKYNSIYGDMNELRETMNQLKLHQKH